MALLRAIIKTISTKLEELGRSYAKEDLRALKFKYPQFYSTSTIDVMVEYKTEMRHVELQAGRRLQFCMGYAKKTSLRAWHLNSNFK